MNKYKYLLNLIQIIYLYISINNNYLIINKNFNNELQILNNISLIKVTGSEPDTLSTLSSNNSDDLDLNSDNNSEGNSEKKETENKNSLGNKLGFKGIFSQKSKSLSDINTQRSGLGSKLLNLIKTKKAGKGSSKNTLNKEKEKEKEKESDDEDEREDDENENDQMSKLRYPSNLANSNIISSGDSTNYAEQIVTLYLESNTISSESQINKAFEILTNNMSVYKQIKAVFEAMEKERECSEELFEQIFLVSIQIKMASDYCHMMSTKVTNESGYCKNRCKYFNSKSCETCRKAFKKRDKCDSLISKVTRMLEILSKISRLCFIRKLSKHELRQHIFYKKQSVYKCSQEQYKSLLGKYESKIFDLSLTVSHVNNLNKLKIICSKCIREECSQCKSVTDCLECPGFEDLTACIECQLIQTLVSQSLILRNNQLMDIRYFLNKLLSCQNYLASKSPYHSKQDGKSDQELVQSIREKVDLMLNKYNPDFESKSKQTIATSDLKSKYKTVNTMPEDLRLALVSGVRLKNIKKPKVPPKPKDYADKIKYLNNKAPESSKKENESKVKIPQKQILSSLEERELALRLFEKGVCTHLMLHLLELELSECIQEINDLTSGHVNCEVCSADVCRRGNCSISTKVTSLVKLREEISNKIHKCNGMGHLVSSELKNKIAEVKEEMKQEKLKGKKLLTSMPPITSSIPSTSSAMPSITSAMPSTSSKIPSTSSKIPSITSAMPSTSSAMPSASSAMPSTSSAMPSTSKMPSTASEQDQDSDQDNDQNGDTRL